MPVPTQEQFDAYAAAPEQFSAILSGLSETQMSFSPTEDEWSINEIIVHTADAEVFYYERLRKTIAEDNPSINAFDENAFTQRLIYRSQSRGLGLALLAALRNSSSALLSMLTPEAWERTCIHPKRGTLSLYDLFVSSLDHSTEHLAQIEHLKATM